MACALHSYCPVEKTDKVFVVCHDVFPHVQLNDRRALVHVCLTDAFDFLLGDTQQIYLADPDSFPTDCGLSCEYSAPLNGTRMHA